MNDERFNDDYRSDDSPDDFDAPPATEPDPVTPLGGNHTDDRPTAPSEDPKPLRKHRANDFLYNLSPAAQEQVIDWLLDGGPESTQRHIQENYDVKLRLRTLGRFRAHYIARRMESMAVLLELLQKVQARHPVLQCGETPLLAAAQIRLEYRAFIDDDLKAFQALRQLRQKDASIAAQKCRNESKPLTVKKIQTNKTLSVTPVLDSETLENPVVALGQTGAIRGQTGGKPGLIISTHDPKPCPCRCELSSIGLRIDLAGKGPAVSTTNLRDVELG